MLIREKNIFFAGTGTLNDIKILVKYGKDSIRFIKKR